MERDIQLTIHNPEYVQIRIVCRHTARCQGVLAVAEKVLPYLRVPEGFHVFGVAVDAAAGFVDAEDGDGLVGARGEFAAEVRV